MKSLLELLPKLDKSFCGPIDAGTREERITQFNKMAEKNAKIKPGITSTFDYVKKNPSQTRRDVKSLFPVLLSDLEVGKTHRGFVAYCRVATKVMVMNSAMCLVEDKNEQLMDLAVYNMEDTKDLREGRALAILEPFFKTRNDGSFGIRVDNPEVDLIFDIEEPKQKPGPPPAVPAPEYTMTLEERVHDVVASNPGIGINKLHEQLVGEGYNISKKRVRAIKSNLSVTSHPNDKESLGKQSTTQSDPPEAVNFVPILSERRPEKHRVINCPDIFNLKEKGNKAFTSKNLEDAEAAYSCALEKCTKENTKNQNVVGNTEGGAHFFTLHTGGRSPSVQ